MAATALSPQAEQIGRLILRTALAKGVSPQRAPELVDAAYSESSLNPAAVNKTSGASGLFQLLSPGYVHEAQQLGGVTSPAANLDAILPEYRSYWQANPGAPAGAAAAAVERSGEGAGFYSNGVGRQIQGSGPLPAPRRATGPQKPASGPVNALAALSAELLGQKTPAAPAAAGNPLEQLSSELLGSPIAAAPAARQPRAAAPQPSSGGYVAPLANVTSVQRVDQGQDLTGVPGQPVRAIGSAHVDAVKPDPGGFGYAEYYTLTSGPEKGQQIYVGHAQPAVKAGQTVAAGAPIATLLQHPYGASTPGWTEIGYARGGVPAAADFNGEQPTPEGLAFARLLRQIRSRA